MALRNHDELALSFLARPESCQAAAQRRAVKRRSRKRGFEVLEVRRMLTTVYYVGGAAGRWDQASDWSNDAVPTLADDVSINTAAPATVTIQSGDTESVHSLTTATGDTLAITGGSLGVTANSTIAGDFSMTGGSLTASGTQR